MILVWEPSKLPRTMTREQWHEIDRWRRVTQKKLCAQEERMRLDLMTFGTTHPRGAEIANRLVNPPLLVHPIFDDAIKSRTSDF